MQSLLSMMITRTGKVAGIVLERPASFLRADEPAYTLASAVIVIHSHRKLLSLTHGLRPQRRSKGGNGLPLTAAGWRLIASSCDD
jgi:hypothetical protein